MSIFPDGEDLRKAVKWISDEKTMNPDTNLNDLVYKACKKFDLSPKDADFLLRNIKDDNTIAK